MADTTNTPEEMLAQVNAAISAITLTGQSYRIGSRQLVRGDLKQLYAMRNDLLAQVNAGTDGLLDNTYVAVFDTR